MSVFPTSHQIATKLTRETSHGSIDGLREKRLGHLKRTCRSCEQHLTH